VDLKSDSATLSTGMTKKLGKKCQPGMDTGIKKDK
jgi:hypothetical protein